MMARNLFSIFISENLQHEKDTITTCNYSCIWVHSREKSKKSITNTIQELKDLKVH